MNIVLNNAMYNIHGEYGNICNALEYTINLQKEFDHAVMEHYRNSIFYIFSKYIFGVTVDNIYYPHHLYYSFKFKYNGLSYFDIVSKIEKLTTYKTAIERNSELYISEYEYTSFLNSLKIPKGENFNEH